MKNLFKGATFYILILAVIIAIVLFFRPPNEVVTEIPYDKFYVTLKEEKFKKLEFSGRTVQGTLKEKNDQVTTYIPETFNMQGLTDAINAQVEKKSLEITGKPPVTTPWFFELIPSLIMVAIVVAAWFFLMQQTQGGGSKVMNFGRSKARLSHKDDGRPKITFKDVAGLDEEKEELVEIVEFLRNPVRYMELGARIPKGILLVGPPGTGKTYLSKAVAGEAGVPFFSISGSDFVEMFVGVGASRVRDLFENAKKSAPSIIFIDEIDAVGRRRGAGLGGGHDEREQTLNQLLVEMDGFGVNEGIIIMAATNRPDILDPALLRPGRFDRQVMVGLPDVKGREAILRVHSANKPLADDADLKHIAKGTPGFTPADIENLMNEAALLTARLHEKKIRMKTIEEAITKVIAGVAKKSKVITQDERKLTAYHEAGHAVLATLLPNSDPVHHVTIIPRGMAGGFTMILPEEDRYYATKTNLKEHMVHLLGGRVAEKLVLGDISTGASNDLVRVASIARDMVTKYAMTESLGAMAFGDESGEVFLGKDFTTRRNYSEEVASRIDMEIEKLVDEAYDTAMDLLSANLDKLHNVAQALLIFETLNRKEYLLAYEGKLDLTQDPEELKKSGDPLGLSKEADPLESLKEEAGKNKGPVSRDQVIDSAPGAKAEEEANPYEVQIFPRVKLNKEKEPSEEKSSEEKSLEEKSSEEKSPKEKSLKEKSSEEKSPLKKEE